MTQEEKARAYDKALEQAKKELNTCGSMDCDAARQIFRFFPQLTESEDERIMKEIESIIRVYGKTQGEWIAGYDMDTLVVHLRDAFAYLEKQKEQQFTHHETDESLQDAVTHQIEDDGNVDDFVRKGIDKIALKYAELGARWQKEQMLYEPKNWPADKDALTQEQKPVEYLDKDKVYAIMTKLTNLSYSQLIPINSDEFKKLDEITTDVRSLLDYPIEQKPAEWNEEDEKMRKRAICACNFTIEKLLGSTHYEEARDWLKSLPIGFITNPNYNSFMVDLLVNELQTIAKYNGVPKQYDAEISWLKSLRPQPKAELTLLDENIIEAAVAFVEQNDHFNVWGGIDKHAVIKALRSLKPQWKPGEEQMAALVSVTKNLFAEMPERHRLESLHNDLKKLM